MDAVSHLLQLARVEARLDKRCLLAASTRMDVTYDQHVAPFHVLLEGECELRVGGTSLRLEAGDMVIIPGGKDHRVTTGGRGSRQGTTESEGGSFTTTRSESGAAVIDLFCGHFAYGPGAGGMLFRSLPDPVKVSFGSSTEAGSVLRTLSGLMRDEAEREGAGTAAIMSALCTVLLAMVLRTAPGSTGPVLWTAADDRPIAELVESVIADPGADWSIERMAAAARMSRATLIRRFRKSTGSTTGEFLARTRLMTAAELLRVEDENIASVALRVGYQSESAFSRAFREATGRTPARFRRIARNAES